MGEKKRFVKILARRVSVHYNNILYYVFSQIIVIEMKFYFYMPFFGNPDCRTNIVMCRDHFAYPQCPRGTTQLEGWREGGSREGVGRE